MSRVLVTGGNGFLGGHLVAALRDRGHGVRSLVRSDDGALPPDAVERVLGDVRDADAMRRAVAGMDFVIHTVSNFRRGGSDRREAHAINVQGSLNVCQAAQREGVRQLIHCSTIGVHGSVKQIPADESTPFNPGDLYQETKLEAEILVREHAERTGLPTTVIRPISMLGPGDRRMLKLFRLIKRRRFIVFGSGEVLFQPAYIDDVVRGFLLCLGNDKAPGEVFIIGGEEHVTLNRLVELIAQELGVRPLGLHVPLAPIRLAASLCEALFVPLGLEPPLHRRRVSFFENNRAFRIDKARRLLGYEPQVSLEQAITRTAAWYRDQGWL